MRRVGHRGRARFAILAASVAAITSVPMSSRAADIFWSKSTGGTFATGSNWQGSVAPGTGDVAQFGTTASGTGPAYTVTFGADATTLGAAVRRDNATWSLGAHTYTLSGTSTSPLLVGSVAGATGKLTVSDGTVTSDSTVYSAVGPVAIGSPAYAWQNVSA